MRAAAFLSRLLRPLPSPAALGLAAAWGGLSMLGGREAVGVLSGTVASGAEALGGLAYAAAYFGALLLGPPLAVTGVVRALSRESTSGERC